MFAVAGEVERLLREYRQNQDMVRGIGTHFYQIIYPVQLRHHEKMGISTREIGAPKVSLVYYLKLLDCCGYQILCMMLEESVTILTYCR